MVRNGDWKFLGFILIIGLIAMAEARRVKRVVGGRNSAEPPPDDPVVFVKMYGRSARVEGFRNPYTGLYSFLGIPFTYPPIGEDRFMRPRYKPLSGDVNATKWGQPCPQPDQQSGYMVGDEDCLWLNVFTPQMPDESTGLPVLVWIHGGGYRFGSANQYGPDPLTDKGVIFVPIQYRLGTLGILGDGTTEFSGNAALFDMNAALRWVSEYISFFGGDPKQITIIGHGSGASAAVYLTTSRVPRDSVSGVVAMSGSPYTQYSIDTNPGQSMHEIAAIHSCSTANETVFVKCLRSKSVNEIVEKDSKVQIERLQGRDIVKSMTGNVGYGPVIERPNDLRSLPGFIEHNPQDVMKNGTFKKVPLLTGVTKDETANGFLLKEIEQIFSSTTEFLNSVATQLAVVGSLNNLTKILPGLDRVVPLGDYLRVPEKLGVADILKKVTEATTDALFNLPAFLTAQTWSKVAPAYLYSFEYAGSTKANGFTFLKGLPLVSATGKNREEKLVAHGDELVYLFDARDLFGKSIQNNSQLAGNSDKKVRDIFTNLIAKFASINSNAGKGVPNKELFQEYDKDANNFIQIDHEVAVKKDFRFCQLSLWGANVQPASKETSCEFILNQLTSALTNIVGETLGGTVGGLLGGNANKHPQAGKEKNGGKKKNSGGLLGLF